mmetsp:Transcript_25856/g.89181  ORF Transcript_25856/g.89181 Transcript_25856/m.89181 type:complete len:419 (-) Transcript_25856:70-1326(-)
MGFQLSLAGLRPKERAVLLTGTGFVVAGIVVRLARRRRIVAPDVLCGDDDSSLAIAVRAMATMRGFSPHAAMLCGGLVSTAWLGLRMPFSTGGLRGGHHVETVDLPDGAAVTLSWWRAKRRAGAPIALVLPGMGNSSETGFVRRLLNELDAAGLDATALDYRGCGTAAGLGLLTSLHSAKSWTDVEAVLKHLEVTEPNSTVYIVGHSLGGCLALSVLGRSCPANVGAACIISAPTDFVAGMKRINGTGPGSRLVSFLLTLPTKFMLFSSASLRRQLSKRGVDVRGALWATSLKQVEEATVCKLEGYATQREYYDENNPLHHMRNIRVPTLLLHAEDDCVVLAPDLATMAGNPNLVCALVPVGGHLTFLERDGACWAERVAVEFLALSAGHDASPRHSVEPTTPRLQRGSSLRGQIIGF